MKLARRIKKLSDDVVQLKAAQLAGGFQYRVYKTEYTISMTLPAGDGTMGSVMMAHLICTSEAPFSLMSIESVKITKNGSVLQLGQYLTGQYTYYQPGPDYFNGYTLPRELSDGSTLLIYTMLQSFLEHNQHEFEMEFGKWRDAGTYTFAITIRSTSPIKIQGETY